MHRASEHPIAHYLRRNTVRFDASSQHPEVWIILYHQYHAKKQGEIGDFTYLHGFPYIDQQGVSARWWRHAVPDPIPENLKPVGAAGNQENGDDRAVGVRLYAHHEIGPWARRVVVESGMHGRPAAELIDEVLIVVVQPRDPRHRSKDVAFHPPASHHELMQGIPAERTHTWHKADNKCKYISQEGSIFR